ncbi:MAG: zinc metallopeptidase [Aggregatilineales bacterium]
MFFFDTNYLILVLLPTIVLSGLAQLWVSSAFQKWGNTRNGLGMTGVSIGERIKQSAGLTAVRFESVAGQMSDHFDPADNVVRISQDVATKPSVAAMAIIAHELGHAQQYQEKSPLIAMRSFLVPAMRLSPSISYGLIVAGLLFNATGLLTLGIIFFSVVVVFSLLTLPVEFDASRRGLKLLQEAGLATTSQDVTGSRQILTAAAMTYVAAFLTSLLTLLYYISLLQRRN